MKLIIANKNYSSWSLRPWLLMKQLGIAFEEERLSFLDPAFGDKLKRISPAGRVPVLVDGELAIWDSLAIVEYLAETKPEAGVWPAERAARARARSICAEMHAGFGALRESLPMNCGARFPAPLLPNKVRHDVDRIVSIWSESRSRFAAKGPFLFGTFSAADAYYAPVVRRFVTYSVELPDAARGYVESIDQLPSMQAWLSAARAEREFVPADEPYREAP